MKILDCKSERAEIKGFKAISRLLGAAGFQEGFVNLREIKFC